MKTTSDSTREKLSALMSPRFVPTATLISSLRKAQLSASRHFPQIEGSEFPLCNFAVSYSRANTQPTPNFSEIAVGFRINDNAS